MRKSTNPRAMFEYNISQRVFLNINVLLSFLILSFFRFSFTSTGVGFTESFAIVRLTVHVYINSIERVPFL